MYFGIRIVHQTVIPVKYKNVGAQTKQIEIISRCYWKRYAMINRHRHTLKVANTSLMLRLFCPKCCWKNCSFPYKYFEYSSKNSRLITFIGILYKVKSSFCVALMYALLVFTNMIKKTIIYFLCLILIYWTGNDYSYSYMISILHDNNCIADNNTVI